MLPPELRQDYESQYREQAVSTQKAQQGVLQVFFHGDILKVSKCAMTGLN
jgi:hypothetical protein